MAVADAVGLGEQPPTVGTVGQGHHAVNRQFHFQLQQRHLWAHNNSPAAAHFGDRRGGDHAGRKRENTELNCNVDILANALGIQSRIATHIGLQFRCLLKGAVD